MSGWRLGSHVTDLQLKKMAAPGIKLRIIATVPNLMNQGVSIDCLE